MMEEKPGPSSQKERVQGTVRALSITPHLRISWWPPDFQVLTSASTEAGLGTM